MRLRLDLAYDGSDFHGWASQPGLRTVQGELQAALTTILREPARVTCAGRTDAGVHARGQVAHLDLETDPGPLETLVRRLDGLLPADIVVRRVVVAPGGFDARFSALWRRYAFRIADLTPVQDPLTRRHVLSWPRELDVAAMNRAATELLGEHDFAAFCKKRDGATTVRSLLDLTSVRDEQGVLVTTVRADAFCHNMVRSLLGCLVFIGEGRYGPSWAGDLLRGGVRDSRSTVLAAHGLTLEEVAYPADAELATQATTARVVRTLG